MFVTSLHMFWLNFLLKEEWSIQKNNVENFNCLSNIFIYISGEIWL